jgi:hypothetical protein
MILIGSGVVVTTARGSLPRRSPNISMSHASGYRVHRLAELVPSRVRAPAIVMPRRTAALKKTWSLTSLRQKLGPRCHDVGERGQPRFRASRRVFWPMSLRAGLARLASATASASMLRLLPSPQRFRPHGNAVQ